MDWKSYPYIDTKWLMHAHDIVIMLCDTKQPYTMHAMMQSLIAWIPGTRVISMFIFRKKILSVNETISFRWSLIAGRLPGRTANDVNNYWNSHLSKKLDVRDHKERSKHGNKVFKPRPQTIPRTWIWSRDQLSSASEIQQEKSKMQEIPSSSKNHKAWVDAQIIGVPNVENIITKEMQTDDKVTQDLEDKKDDESLTGVGGWEDLLRDINLWGDLGTI